MNNIMKRVSDKVGRDIRLPFEPDEERKALENKYGEHILETHFYREPIDYGLTKEEEDFYCAFILWWHFESDGHNSFGYTEDDMLLAEMEYEEYLESQNK